MNCRMGPFVRKIMKSRHPWRHIFPFRPVGLLNEADQITVQLDIPGFEKEDIDIKVGEDELVIKAETTIEIEKPIMEKSQRKFYDAIKLPAAVKPEGTKAKYEKGVLTIILPKREPQKKIDIE
ncbi:MAG: Hsp20/alpha crystallin family protein [Candidatus Hodarchaeota archaeon]